MALGTLKGCTDRILPADRWFEPFLIKWFNRELPCLFAKNLR